MPIFLSYSLLDFWASYHAKIASLSLISIQVEYGKQTINESHNTHILICY